MESVKPTANARANELAQKLVSVGNIKPQLECVSLIKNWLTVGGLSVLFGPSNVGKSFLAIDIAVHVAGGLSWFGHRVKAGSVVYIAAEGGSAIFNRFAAVNETRTSDAEIVILPTALDLYGPNDAQALCLAMPYEEPALIIVDTLARSFGDGDENKSSDMGAFIRNIDYLRDLTGAHVMVVHHSDKDSDKGARGSSSLRSAVDTEIKVTGGQAVCTKQRDMAKPDAVYFALRQVKLGTDQDGDPVTSAVVELAPTPKPRCKPLPLRQRTTLEALNKAIQKHGTVLQDDNIPTNREAVTWKQ